MKAKQTTHQIWVDSDNKIASFHPIEHAECISFLNSGMFLRYIQGLVTASYRFQ